MSNVERPAAAPSGEASPPLETARAEASPRSEAPSVFDLAEGELVLVDSSALVYLIEGSPRRKAAVELFLAEARRLGLRLAVSAIAWTELLDKPRSSGDDELASRYRRLLADSDRLVVAPVDVAIAEEAARLRAASSVRADARLRATSRLPAVSRGRPEGALTLGDALHIATAIVLGAAAVLGNDEAWRDVPGCPRLILVDELAFHTYE